MHVRSYHVECRRMAHSIHDQHAPLEATVNRPQHKYASPGQPAAERLTRAPLLGGNPSVLQLAGVPDLNTHLVHKSSALWRAT